MPEATESLLAYCVHFDGSGGKLNVQRVFSRKRLYVVFSNQYLKVSFRKKKKAIEADF